jgi:hypothetical protein
VIPTVGVSVCGLPHCGNSIDPEYNALRHDCQHFSAAVRQKNVN